MTSIMRLGFLFGVALVLTAVIVLGQSGQGSVRGYVYDGLSHSPVKAAKISLKSIETWKGEKVELNAETDERGDYQIKQAPMGEYTLRISAPGHQSYETTILILSDAHLVMGTRLKGH